MDERIRILKRLEAVPDDDLLINARNWLANGDTRALSDLPIDVTVFQALHLWRIRQKISIQKGTGLAGAEELLAALARLSRNRKLEQFSFSDRELTGSIFFEKTSGTYVGMVLEELGRISKLARAS